MVFSGGPFTCPYFKGSLQHTHRETFTSTSFLPEKALFDFQNESLMTMIWTKRFWGNIQSWENLLQLFFVSSATLLAAKTARSPDNEQEKNNNNSHRTKNIQHVILIKCEFCCGRFQVVGSLESQHVFHPEGNSLAGCLRLAAHDSGDTFCVCFEAEKWERRNRNALFRTGPEFIVGQQNPHCAVSSWDAGAEILCHLFQTEKNLWVACFGLCNFLVISSLLLLTILSQEFQRTLVQSIFAATCCWTILVSLCLAVPSGPCPCARVSMHGQVHPKFLLEQTKSWVKFSWTSRFLRNKLVRLGLWKMI